MKNLAGDRNASTTIKDELTRCGIESFDNPEYRHPEVKTIVNGRIRTIFGDIILHRNWTYWVTSGPVPLETAKVLYADPIGKTDIRVSGHCGCPPPEFPWVEWILEDGRRVLPTSCKKSMEELISGGGELGKVMEEESTKFEFNDDPASIGAKGFIEVYHIDSELGLYIFVQTLRNRRLTIG